MVYPQSTVREIAYSEVEFGETLGKGGQGAVYKGQWKTKSFSKTGSLSVAIKRVLGKIRNEEVSYTVLKGNVHHYAVRM